MDLPPTSYHDSLEEFWDEEEEPEEIETSDEGCSLCLSSVFGCILQGESRESSSSPCLSQSVSTTERGFHHRFTPSLPSIVETDASDYALGVVLSQVSDSGEHPIAFNSCKLIPAELNYEIHYKKLLGIVCALKRWRDFLLSLSSPFEVSSNTSCLQNSSCRCLITSGKHLSGEGGGFHQQESNDFQHLIKQDEAQPSGYFAVKVESFSNFIESIQEKLWQEPQYRSILQELGKLQSVQDYSLDSSSQLLLFKDWVVVPNDPTIQLSILERRQESPLAGNPGQEKTLKLVKRDLHSSSMTQFMKEYVPSCQQCSKNKKIHHKNGHILKNCRFIPTMSSITSLDLGHSLIKNIFSKHGLPSSIHPEADGQTERLNQILEQYLQIDPQFDLVQITLHNSASTLSTKIQSVQQDVKRELEASINWFKRFADKSRATPPDFIPGHMVWLSFKSIKSTRPTKKLSERWLSPFPILKKFSTNAYHLKLPSQWKSFHPVFAISILEPVKTSTIPNWHQKPPPPIIIEEEEE
ncbi:hypothetical protein O181_031041 [Austropuccinia psidii MF-1]|uniref:Reverse transcriptase/retrotransposon-derived protein RNase H-like domain-containing protein n=1 Tax=Austropuccinia psidii MF-1 TaxID=1389203 RepID=A0A9Q3CU34_9BASI|nr:hypothetical protein [Austropuccinia psidii MF-1]